MSTPPKFEKTNHHYIPQFWLRRFADVNGQLWKRESGSLTATSASKVMSEDWLYTEFDHFWRPGDGVEDKLSKIESLVAPLFDRLHASNSPPSSEEWKHLCWWLALTACRHPEAMRRGHKKAKEFAYELADVSSHATATDFMAQIRTRYGVHLPIELAPALAAKGDEALLEEAEAIEGLSAHDPRLPMLLALEATGEVAHRIMALGLHLLDVPGGKSFVLGDRPVPLLGLSSGFATPLSANLAIAAWPVGLGNLPTRGRSKADTWHVDSINRDQATQAASVVIGPDRAVLSSL